MTRPYIPAIRLDRIGHALEGKERDTGREQDVVVPIGEIEVHERGQPVNISEKEVAVFEETKDPEVGYDTYDQQQLPFPRIINSP